MNAQEWSLTITAGREQADRCAVTESPRERLSSVWREMSPELSRLASAMGVSAHSVDDVLQDVYLAGLQKHPHGLGREELRRWLFRVTLNRCHLEHRRRRRWRVALTGLALFKSSSKVSRTEDVILCADRRELVAAALESLEPELRSVLVLRYFCEMNSKEIGQILDLPDSTVRSQLRTARWQLAAVLKRGVGDDEP